MLLIIAIVAGLADAAGAVEMVPFVGCASDGQTGPIEAPTGAPMAIETDTRVAAQLGYYQASMGPRVLAPRGWDCFGLYGSSGTILIVAPALDRKLDMQDLTGPAIVARYALADTSGAYEVAGYLARLFPEEGRRFIQRLVAGRGPLTAEYEFGPYPEDRLDYRGGHLVEFETPPEQVGLGTSVRLKPSNLPAYGFTDYDETVGALVVVIVRLPSDLDGLRTAILEEAKKAAAHWR